MNWISIGLAALSGALAAMIAGIIVRKPKERLFPYAIAFVISFGVLQGLSREFVFPELNAWNVARKADSAFVDIPAFQAIKQHDPKTYEAILSDIRGSLRKGADEAQIIGLVRGHIVGVVQKRLPSASDEAVVSYMAVMVTEIHELHKYSSELCYRFLFPEKSGPIDGRKYFSKRTQEADLAALAQVIKTSAESPQSIPKEAEVMPKLEPVIFELEKKYGNDITMLQNPSAPTVDRGKVCSMTADLYKRIIEMPRNENGKILRFMLSQP